jgi:DNA-binding IclR family transcriptional regulator
MRKSKIVAGETEFTPLAQDAHSDLSCYERVARVLVCMSEGASSVTEIAKECDMKVPGVHRLLNSLSKPHLTVYDPLTRRYFLGPLIAQMAANATTNHQYIRMCSRAEMERLSNSCGETITLSLLIGAQFVSILNIESSHALLVHELGDDLKGNKPMLPFGATQKMLLSQLGNQDLLRMINTVINKDRRLTDSDILMAEMQQIHQQGFVITTGERIPGAICISCPIYHYVFPAAISLIGPKIRLAKKVQALLQSLKESAALISENLLKNQ